MERVVKFPVRNNVNLLKQLVADRWIKVQREKWASGEQECSSLQSLGVKVAYPTVRDWRNGQMPGCSHQIQLMEAGFKAMLDTAFEPANIAGALSTLEAQNAEAKSLILANEREAAKLRAALAGFSS